MKKCKLGDLFKIKQGFAFKKIKYVANSKYAIVTLGNISESNNFKYNLSDMRFYDDDFPKDVILKHGDLILPMTEQVEGLFGNSAFVPKDDKVTFVLNQRVGLVKPFLDSDKYYIHYLLAVKSVRQQLEYRATGTRQRNISPDGIYDVDVEIPEPVEREKIGLFLYTLEQKINNNNHIINTLESMSQNLYDYWFVQFDFPDANGRPYKTSGGKMVWNEELGREIPEGWEVDNLLRIASYVNGLACQKYRPQNNEPALPVIKIREMHEGITNDTELVSASIPDENKIDDGDILFSWSATLEIQHWTGGKGGLNQHIFKVNPNDGFPKEYVYHQLQESVISFVKIAEARKTTMGHITQDHLEFSRIAIPPAMLLSQFKEKIKAIYEQKIVLNKENRRLISFRDFLLPMLMNGQVTFK